MIKPIYLTVIFATFLLLFSKQAKTQINKNSYPFQTIHPNEKNMDKMVLDKMNEYIIDSLSHIRSVLILRNNYIVFEKYYHILSLDELHNVASVTKSFISALTGIAIKEGYIKGIDEKIIDFFPEYNNSNLDTRFKEITVKHLLTMTSVVLYIKTTAAIKALMVIIN